MDFLRLVCSGKGLVFSQQTAPSTLLAPGVGTGRARAGLGVATGAPALVMFDQNGRDRAELYVRGSGKPGLALADENGKTIAGMPEQATTAASTAAQQ